MIILTAFAGWKLNCQFEQGEGLRQEKPIPMFMMAP